MLSAGVNHVPFGLLPAGIVVASNADAYSRPIAEHVLALTLALAKRLPQNHAAMASGALAQRTPNRELHGAVVSILGYGGTGRASATLFPSSWDAHPRGDALGRYQ
jgi:phosphoglycerate dehydrogenase-like enzyme